MRHTTSRRLLSSAVLAALGVAAGSQAASGATYTWSTATGTGLVWTNVDNWGGTGFPGAPGDVANLNIDFVDNITIEVDTGDPTLGVLNWGDSTQTSDAWQTAQIGTYNGAGPVFFNNNGNGAQINTPALLYPGNGSLFRANVILQDDLIITLGGATAGEGNIKFFGAITEEGGSFRLEKRGRGNLGLEPAAGNGNNWTGGTYLYEGRILIAGNAGAGRFAIPGDVEIHASSSEGRLQNTGPDAIVDTANIKFMQATSEWSIGGQSETVGSLSSDWGFGNVHSGNLGLAADSGEYSFGGVIGGSAPIQTLTKSGGSIQTLAGPAANNIAVGVVVTGGVLQLNKDPGVNAISGAISIGDGAGNGAVRLLADNQIDDASSLTLDGGTLDLNGHSETLGVLSSSGDSVIDFGSGAAILTFASADTLSGSLLVLNWTDGADQFLFTDTTGLDQQLGVITFDVGGNLLPAQLVGNAVVPVPEPGAVALLAIGGLAMLRRRRA